MDHGRFVGEMKRLGASYRVDLTANTIAAYWLVFEHTDGEVFHQAVADAIENERTFPTPAVLKVMLGKVREERRQKGAPTNALPAVVGTVQCLTCMDGGFVRRDVPHGHPDFGRLIPCPHCAGARKPRDTRAEMKAHLERQHAIEDTLKAIDAIPVGTPEEMRAAMHDLGTRLDMGRRR